MSGHRRIIGVVAAVVVTGAAALLVINAISTSSARVSATTSGSSFFAAGTVVLTQPDAAVELLFDADNLYPGLEVEGCVTVEYSGSVPGSIRIHGELRGGSGLEDYIDFVLLSAQGDTCEGIDDVATTPRFDGRLSSFWAAHGNYAEAIELVAAARPGDRVVLQAFATVADDNRAQGRTTDFRLTIEVRP